MTDNVSQPPDGSRPPHSSRFPPTWQAGLALIRHSRVRLKDIISGRIAIAVSWIATAMIFGQIIRLAGSLIMTRLLVPEMFGVMSIVLSVQITLGLLLDIGIRAAVIQSPRGDEPAFLNTAWTLQILRGCIIASLVVIIAFSLPGLAQSGIIPDGSAWSAGDLPLVLAIASISVVIEGFQSTNVITAERNLALKRFVIIQLISQLVGFALMVILGLLTGSIWALVLSGIFSTAVLVGLSHTALPGVKNRMIWQREARNEIARYGSWVMLSSIAFVLASQADRLILGGMVDTATLGLYSIALNLMLVFEGLAHSCISSVFLPALSEAARESRQAFRARYFRVRVPTDIGTLLCAGGLFALGPAIITILYDDRYLAAGGMVQILSLALVFTRYHLATSAYMALGVPKYMAAVNFAKFFSMILLLLSLSHLYGFEGALYAVALHNLPVLCLIFWLNRRFGLNNALFELGVLSAWPAGYFSGLLLLQLF